MPLTLPTKARTMKNKSLTLAAFGLAITLAICGNWMLAIVLYLAFEVLMSRPVAGCANTLGTLQGELILREALAMVFTKRPVLRRISMGLRDIDNGAVVANFNQVVKTRIKTIVPITDFNGAAAAVTTTDVSLTLSRFRSARVTFTPQEYSATNRDLIAEVAEPIAIGIANDIVDDIATLWTPANFPGGAPPGDTNAPGTATGKTVVAGGWNFTNTLVPVDSALADRGVTEEYGRFFAMTTAVYAGFLSDTQITAPLYNPDNQSAVMKGILPEVLGFGLMRYPGLTAASGVANLLGFAGSPGSTVWASRAPKNPEEILTNVKFPGALAILTEPVTGFSVMAMQWIETNLSVNTQMVWMSGKAVGNPLEGQCLMAA